MSFSAPTRKADVGASLALNDQLHCRAHVGAMSFPPPNSGQYPQYIPPQYQPGNVPAQLLYNNGPPQVPVQSPYNGYTKPPGYPQGMMPYPYSQYQQQSHQMPQQIPPQQPLMHPHQQLAQQQPPIQQQHPQFQMQQSPRQQYQQSPHQQVQQLSPRPQFHQQSPRTQLQQQSPRAQFQQAPLPQLQQSPRPHVQQSPRPQFQQQSPRANFQQQSPRQPVQHSPRPQFPQQAPLPQPPPPPKQQVQPPPPPQAPKQIQPQPTPAQSLPPVQPQHQFINPAELFVQPPLPEAPRSRYIPPPDFVDPSALSATAAGDLPLLHSSISAAPLEAPLAPPAQNAPLANPQNHTRGPQGQSMFQIQPPQPVIKVDSTPIPKAPNVERKRPPSTPSTDLNKRPPSAPKATPTIAHQRPTPSPAVRLIPQVKIPPASPEVQKQLQQEQEQQSKKPQQKRNSLQGTEKAAAKPAKPPVDYQVLLLSLADEYLNAAHRHGTKMALATRQGDIEGYYKLVATGLGCLEAVLKNWRLQPRKEALVRLRYARILFEETENDLEAETALSKGIDLCERNRMLDLKYSMQHLLARMLHKTNPKASLKAVDGMIQDVEAYRHAAWEYAFRFLRVSLSLSSSSHQDSVQALQHLHKISAMAGRNGDKAVSAMGAIMEALAHLQHGTGSDAIEQAQRAVAAARSHQLNEELRDIPQLVTLIHMVDIFCSLLEYDVNQATQKLSVMQAKVDETLSDPNWRPDGSFSVPLSGKSAGPSSIDTGDILQVHNGTLLLSFNWLPQHDLYALSYFLSSVTLSSKNSYDGRKAEKYLDEGLRMIQGEFKAPQEIAESMVNATRRVEWRRSLYCSFLLQRVFLACSRTDWDLAKQSLKELRVVTQDIGHQLPASIQCLMEYAAGTISQASGDLSAALATFQSPLLSLSSSISKTARNDPCRDTCILAALNTVLIIRDPAHPSHSHLPNILATLESFCQGSPSKYIQAAYFLVCATVNDSTVQTKQYLQQALQSATAISNNQITCMTLTFMSWKYFRGVVGEQAEKSARAGRAMARRANDRLWASVTDEMLADTLERQGKGEEARDVRAEGQRLIMGLPPGLKRS
ncbi:uncharacterized protein N7443_000608 [Penicillium atrosanguineum]|uniref:75k gamma secalin n=1 Tax=Penicillium atrosanguineum TaxID=1132637 RepID=A0A9W9QCJ9_9EURO|nr:uncharacterized protein N7443_000608 [Penicillium atrosanguineum]KAJ5313724.1 hypothetical protein N7443_000608 [Penicillium atrosanguineum]KAJ5330895.1 hypothetical protein N7476_000678 [Penicillium atrosanguineum]